MTVMEGFGSLSDAWERHAARWERWTRVIGHDVYYEQLNWPAFHALLPPAGRRTLDVGCGEGRVGRVLAAEGHRLAGIDSSPTLVGLAREAGGYEELVCGDAATLPWDAQSFDLALAFMSLHDMDDLTGTVTEIARVLEPGGTFCLAIVHPLNRAPEALDNYFDEHRFSEELELDGLHMTFEGIDRPRPIHAPCLASAFSSRNCASPGRPRLRWPQRRRSPWPPNDPTSYTCGASSRLERRTVPERNSTGAPGPGAAPCPRLP
jgi:SAM-dependent methyltransferase